MAELPPNCIFCITEPVSSAEHVWDDWLNRVDGVTIKDKYQFVEYGPDGKLVRTYPKTNVDIKWPLVCARCNSGWMSDITNESKQALEVIIRNRRHVSLLPRGIAALVSLAFLKAIVADYGGAIRVKPFFLPSVRQRFMRSLAIPEGVVIWVGQCQTGKRMGGHVWGHYLTIRSSVYSGYEIYVCTYRVGYLVFQVAVPRWMKPSRRRGPLPPLGDANHLWSDVAVQVWPGVSRIDWPPSHYFDSESVEIFSDRMNGLKINPTSGALLIPLPPVTPGQN